MASTYSQLKIELIGTGDQAGTWGATTNTNLGTAIEEAITGSANITFASANVALALTDTNATQTARNLRLNLTGTISATQHLFIPAIEKQYLINNGLTNSVIIANGSNSGATGTTFTLPAGRSSVVFNDGTNINDVITYVSSLGNVTITGGTANALTLSNVSIISGNVNNITSNASTFSNVTINGGTANFSGTILVSGNSSSSADIKLYEDTDNGTNYVSIKAPTAITSNATLTVPATDNVTIGYLNIPQSGSAKTTAYPLVTTDVGKVIEVGSGGSVEIPNATFSAGDAVLVFNNTSAGITITCSITTAYIAGTDADKATMTLATRGIASILFISGTVCVVSGNVT